MALRLTELQDCPLHTEGAFCGGDGAEFAALRAGLLFAQLLPLLGGRLLQGTFGQTLSCGLSDLFHLGEIDIEARAAVAKGLPHDDFAPLLGESGDRLQFFGCQLPCCHDVVILDVRAIRQGEVLVAHPTRTAWRRKGRPALKRKRMGASRLR